MDRFRELARDGSRKELMVGAELATTRGFLEGRDGQRAMALGEALCQSGQVDWIGITDNPGGNPMLAPSVLGRKMLELDVDVVVNLTCKDRNRNALESIAWQYESERLNNILCLTGDYPAPGHQGPAVPVFDLDSTTLLRLLLDMNGGLQTQGRRHGSAARLEPTDFFPGATVSPFKTTEAELVCQYLKLELKLANGAHFIIPQLGYDMRKSHELLAYLRRNNPDVPMFGNVYILSPGAAELFHDGAIPGCQVSPALLERCRRAAASPDKGRAFFLELAAKQVACFKGLGYRGVHVGGFRQARDVIEVLEIAEGFAPDDWRGLAQDVIWPEANDFYLFARDEATGLADPERESAEMIAAREEIDEAQVTPLYRFNAQVHKLLFDPNGPLHRPAKEFYRYLERHPKLGAVAEWQERVVKSALFNCQDCGDCSLADCSYICPASGCKKHGRNGPCGGSHAGRCEAADKPCLWYRAYHRAKKDGQLDAFLRRPLIVRNPDLAQTSSWANYFMARDHAAAGGPEDEGTGGREERS